MCFTSSRIPRASGSGFASVSFHWEFKPSLFPFHSAQPRAIGCCERDAISGSVDSLGSLCKGVPELSVALDPSHFIFDRETPADYDALIPRTSHVRLRDTTAKNFQVQIGQGVLEYNRLVAQLRKNEYNRALCVDLAPLPNLSPESELRKMRLLMESIL